jgi:glycosyltransferase involved in cell wall biosynthesis
MIDLSNKSIGWVPEGPIEWAACRMRVFEIADALTKHYGIKNYIGNMPSSVNAFVAQKICSPKVLDVANALKANGARTVFDLCDPHWLIKDDVLARRGWDVVRAINECDHIIAPSDEMKRLLHRDFTGKLDISVIPEGFDFDIGRYKARSHYGNSEYLKVGWIGIGSAIGDICSIMPQLAEFHKMQKIILRLITVFHPNAPQINYPGLPIEYVPWTLDGYHRALAECDIAVIPIVLGPYKVGKSVNRLALCMAMGVPAVVSPLASYVDYLTKPDCAFSYIADEHQWADKLKLLLDPGIRQTIAVRGHDYVRATLDLKLLLPKWIDSVLGIKI